MTTQAAKGKQTRLSNHELANLSREGHTPEDIAAAHGYGGATIRARLRDLGLDETGQPVAVVAPARRTPVVGWYGDGDESWRDQAACFTEGHNPELFFVSVAQQPKEAAEAKAICGRCPVRAACLAAALRAEDGQPRQYRAGIVGGMTVDERMAHGAEAVA